MPSVAAPGLGELETRLGRWRADPRGALAGLLGSQPDGGAGPTHLRHGRDAGLDPTTFATGAAKGLAGAVMRGASRGANPLIDLSRRVMPTLTRAIDRLPDIGVFRNARDLPAGVLGRFDPPHWQGMAMRQQYPGGLLQLAPVRPGTRGAHQTIAHLLESLGHEGGHALFYHRNVAPRGARGKLVGGTGLPNLTSEQARDALIQAVRRGDMPEDLVQQYFARDPDLGLQHALIERLGQLHLGRGWPQGL